MQIQKIKAYLGRNIKGKEKYLKCRFTRWNYIKWVLLSVSIRSWYVKLKMLITVWYYGEDGIFALFHHLPPPAV